MRFLILFVIFSFCMTPSAFSAGSADFDSFIKSREVVATLYFQANSEDLLKGERERITAAISQLRDLQKDGRMIRVEGFSSAEGDEEVNFRLSFFRARAVADVIEAKGMPSEIALTGYGDLRATSDDPVKERRVEIASYIKPISMKRIKIAKESKEALPSVQSDVTQAPTPYPQEIDSYSIEQAIKKKIEDRNKGLADKADEADRDIFPGMSHSDTIIDAQEDLERGYTQWRMSVDPQYAPKVTQTNNAAGDDLKRGYSQSVKAADSDLKRGYSQSVKAADNDLKRGYSQSEKAADSDLKRGYSQSEKAADSDLKRGYSQSEKAADSDLKRGYSQSEKAADSDLKRGYSQSEKAADSDLKRGYSQSEKAADSDLKRGYSQSEKAADSDLKRGYSQSEKAADSDLKRGYSQSEKAADSDLKRGYSQSEKAVDSDLKRGYSQWQKNADPELTPGVTKVTPVGVPYIDALMIEQAIMDKIGAELPVPADAVSQLDVSYLEQ